MMMGTGEIVVIVSIIGTIVVSIAVSIGIAIFMRKMIANLNASIQFQPVAMPVAVPQGPPQIKRTACRNCGGFKVKPPKTACMYCDFCGAFVDWDFRIAVSTAGSARPAPALQQLMAQEKAFQAQARANNDVESFKQSVRRIYEQHTVQCAAAYSPRIGDPKYKHQLIEYLALVDSALGFDPESQQHEASVASLRRMLPRAPGHGHLDMNVFRQLVAAKKAATARAVQLLAPHIHLHPDEASAEIAAATINSTFTQYWLPFLDAGNRQWLIAEMGLAGEYVELSPVPLTERHCGSCGDAVHVPQGASRVVCEKCGHFNDVSAPEVQCPGCGGPTSVPSGATTFSCPYCQMDMRADGMRAL